MSALTRPGALCLSVCVSVCVCVYNCEMLLSYIKESHLPPLLARVRADKLDKLLEGLLRVVADGRVGEVRAGLLDDGRRGEMQARRSGVWTRCRRTERGWNYDSLAT